MKSRPTQAPGTLACAQPTDIQRTKRGEKCENTVHKCFVTQFLGNLEIVSYATGKKATESDNVFNVNFPYIYL